MSDGALIFVYGSLQRGCANHARIAHAEHLGPATTEPRYRLHDLGDYPALVEAGESAVHGELYRVDAATLRALDEFESEPEAYARRPVRLAGVDGAQAYFLSPDQVAQEPIIGSGAWPERAGDD